MKRNLHFLIRLMLMGALLATVGSPPSNAATSATEWHVAPSGSDSASCGSQAQPCKRIATAIRKALPHDTILLAGGIYTETLAISKTLTLASASPQFTAIDGAEADSVIRIMALTSALTITGVTIQHGRAAYGGGIDNFNGGDLTLIGSTVMSNTATATAGGGIFNYGNLTLINSTIAENVAATGGGIASNFGTLTITNTTISRNTARGVAAQGGGIFAGNGAVVLQNTLLAGNSGDNGPDCAGALRSAGYNLVGNSARCMLQPAIGDQIGTATRPIDAQLGPLDDYGGPTPTFTLRAGSPAIDAGNPAPVGSTACPATDQRGVVRPQSLSVPSAPRCDIGAYEYNAPIVLPWLYLPIVQR